MKQYWQKIALRIDALSLRERVIIFAMIALVLVMAFNTLLLDSQYKKQKDLSQRIRQEQSQIEGMQAEMQQKALLQATDPDSANKGRLQQLRQQSGQMRAELKSMQKGLVSPDKMSSLLEDMLKNNPNLHLVSLKTLPVSLLNELADKTDNQQGSGAVYKHGVEIVIEGNYLAIVEYLAQLQKMPWHLLWNRAKLNVGEYPKSTLRLTLFTLSLDEKWLNL